MQILQGLNQTNQDFWGPVDGSQGQLISSDGKGCITNVMTNSY